MSFRVIPRNADSTTVVLVRYRYQVPTSAVRTNPRNRARATWHLVFLLRRPSYDDNNEKSILFHCKVMENKRGLLDDDEMCSRGLESRTRSGAQRRRQQIEASVDTVLCEQ
jgi:hypothetical protein